MYNTFREAKQLTVVDFSNCDVTKVNNMGGLFQGCSGLITLDLSTFRTSSALKDTRNMFDGCTSLISLDLRNFYTYGVTSMMNMFYNCRTLSNLDLSGFSTHILSLIKP